MTKKRVPIEELSGDCLDHVPIDCDWSEELGDNCDGFTSYEEVECNCGHLFVAARLGYQECPKCGEECDPVEGPMMNYYYPLELRYGMSFEEAAKKIAHLPLCFVEFENGRTGIALTGGGMDLSWEIIRAHLALGFLPPLHFLPPPRMAGWEHDSDAEYILKACEATADVMVGRAQRRLEDVKQLRKERRAALRKKG